MAYTREDVRAKLLAYKSNYAKREPIELDWLPEFGVLRDQAEVITEDNRLQIREMMGDESMSFDKEFKADPPRAVGRIVAKCLLMPGSSTSVFNETDLTVIMSELGSSVLAPIIKRIQEMSGATPDAKAEAAKNLPPTPPNASTTN